MARPLRPRPRQKRLKSGKLPIGLLGRLLKKYAPGGPGLIVGPAPGMDSAVIDFHGRSLVAKTDPITFVAEGIGAYALHVNANDIAVMGGTPRWFLATVLLPEATATERLAESVFRELSAACRELGVVLAGGHTEVTAGIDIPIVVGQMLGEVKKGRLVTAGGALPGDAVILTKGIAIEATSIIARNMGERLVKKGAFTRNFIRRSAYYFKRPGISVVKDAAVLLKCARVHAMHDPTEGGLATGLYELALASGTGIEVDSDAIHVFSETRKLAEHFNIDPMGAIASGALVAAVDTKDSEKAVAGLVRAGIKAARIGTVTEKRHGLKVRSGRSFKRLKPFERDEITKIFKE